jgi:alanine racemase
LSELLRARIDTHALRANLRVIRERAPRTRVMAVVKANAYGHGLLPVARALRDADAFAVARIDEAVALRNAGITQAIVLLEGVFSSEQLEAARVHRLELVVHQRSQLELLEQAQRRDSAGAAPGVVWIKIDTGMNRLGFRAEEFRAALERVRSLARPPAEIRVLTHLARADEPDCAMTARQIAEFRDLTQGLGYATSSANSAGVLGGADPSASWVRPGLALYGVSPFHGVTAPSLGLRPAMQFETSVIAVREVGTGESVGYGGTWVARSPTRVAILAAGYGDGFPWGLSAGAHTLIEGRHAAVIGRVSMDMLAVDVTDIPTASEGASAVLWGAALPVEQVADWAGTIPYVLLCAVSLRVPREYLGVPREP